MPAVWANLTGDCQAMNLDNWQFAPYEDNTQLRIIDFDGAVCNSDCIGLTSGEGQFDYIGIKWTYSGTITLGGPVTAYWMWQCGGTIEQADPEVLVGYPPESTDLTILQWWQWEDGVITSTDYRASIIVEATMASIATESWTSDGDVDLGSNIELNPGAVLSVQGGTVNIIAGGLEILVKAGAGIVLEATTGSIEFSLDLPLIAPVFRLLGPALVGPNGSWMEFRKGTCTLDAGIENRGGRLTVMREVHLNLTRGLPGGNTAAYDQQGGILELTNGSTLDIWGNKDISIDGGIVRTIAGTWGASTNAVVRVREFMFFDGELFINDDTIAHQYGSLTIQGRMEWDGGTYRPRVDAAIDTGYCDELIVTGRMTYRSGVLDPIPLDGEDNEVTPGFSSSWVVLRGGELCAVDEIDCGDVNWNLPLAAPPMYVNIGVLSYQMPA